ncbi:MAG: J domain-containing protein [Chitinispirillaceae bacterium]|nr:J domain-containing protein [Chitinispirillaceae bacterium]
MENSSSNSSLKNTLSTSKYSFILRIISAIMLYVPLWEESLYLSVGGSYYTLLRIIVCATSIYCAILSFLSNQKNWGIIFILVAFLFNPLFPFRLSRELWEIIDILVANFFCLSFIYVSEKRLELEKEMMEEKQRRFDKFYHILGVSPNATYQEIDKAYKEMVKVWHPDRFKEGTDLYVKAHQQMKAINEAYEVIVKRGFSQINDEAKNRKYDALLSTDENKKDLDLVALGKFLYVTFWVVVTIVILNYLNER